MNRTIFTNGIIHTLDHRFPICEAIVVENGRIVDVGTYKDMDLQWGRSGITYVDLEGKTASPGLIDSHLHMSGLALFYLDLDLTGVTSKAAMLDMIREKANSLSEGEWLLGMGWDENLFGDGGIPTLEELDAVAPHCPLYLKRTCHHAFLVNSQAMEISGCDKSESPNVVRDPETGKPTGLLLEGAANLVTPYIPERTYDEMKGALGQAMKFAVSKGLTSVHTNDPLYLGGFEQTYRMYDELLNGGEHALRCNLLIDYPFLQEMTARNMKTGYGNDTLKIGAVKMFADGAFGRRTALLSAPYSDDPGHYGEAIQEEEELLSMFKAVREAGMPVAVHTIGDQALDMVLGALAEFPAVAYRDRIIHTSLIRDDLVGKMAAANIIADIQPRFLAGDFPWIQQRLGEARIKDLYAWKTLLSAGILCAGGSDAPVEPVDPLLGIHAAVTRRSPGERHGGWNEGQKLSMFEALRLFTIGGAYATNEEDVKGTLSPGKMADMTVYSKDILKLEDPDELLDTEIDMTVIGGNIQNI
ncbi:amidohydrolase [Bacillus testis]|uniref:amidohydrolase n=1 Tax=Bacillus testis TaxID=1622072 RepID=UPI00067F36CA|nr:amidohydrolase [Bacillus testis]